MPKTATSFKNKPAAMPKSTMAAIPHTAAMAPSSATQAALRPPLSTTSPAVKMTAALASASAFRHHDLQSRQRYTSHRQRNCCIDCRGRHQELECSRSTSRESLYSSASVSRASAADSHGHMPPVCRDRQVEGSTSTTCSRLRSQDIDERDIQHPAALAANTPSMAC